MSHLKNQQQQPVGFNLGLHPTLKMLDNNVSPPAGASSSFTPSAKAHSSSNAVTEEQLLGRLQRLMKLNLQNLCYQDAIFFADKLLHLSMTSRGGAEQFIKAVYDLAHCYLMNKENLRCVQLIEKYEMAFHSEQFRIMTAQALFQAANLNACISVLEKNLLNPLENENLIGPNTSMEQNSPTPDKSPEQKEEQSYYKGLRFLLLARAYEAQENKIYAVQFYKEALKHNSASFEAFNRLFANQLLTKDEKRILLEDLAKYLEQRPEDLWLKDYYSSRVEQQVRTASEAEGYMLVRPTQPLNQTSIMVNNRSGTAGYHDEYSGVMSSPSRFQHDLLLEHMDNEDMRLRNPQQQQHHDSPQLQGTAPSQVATEQRQEVCVLEALQHTSGGDLSQQVGCFDLRLIEAERLFNEQNYTRAYEVVKAVIEADFYYVQIVPMYCAVLIELNKVGELYYLAHKLVSANPDLAVAWFSVGSYYFLIKKYDLARKYFNKANRLDKHFAASWIAFGHAFAAQDESDQAMAAYRTAARLFPGCHLAPLFIGMEYLRTNNLRTALLSFAEAQKISGESDPMVHNEVGVVLYRQKNFDQAKDQFANALSLCNESNSRTYETILINLAHCHRKIKDLDSAVMLYEKCLTINPKNASTYTSLGFAHHLKGEFRTALNCYHKAHFLRHEDQLTEELIQRALHDVNEYASLTGASLFSQQIPQQFDDPMMLQSANSLHQQHSASLFIP